MTRPSKWQALLNIETISEKKEVNSSSIKEPKVRPVPKQKPTMQTYFGETRLSKKSKESQKKPKTKAKIDETLEQQASTEQTLLSDPLLPEKQRRKKINDILDTLPKDLEMPTDTELLSKLPDFFCKYCGSTKQEGHIKKIMRERKHKPSAQQWKCKKFNKKFTNDPNPFNYPLWVCYFVSSFISAGMSLQAIKNCLEMIAWEKGEEISISVSSIRRLIEQIIEIVLEFEESIEHPIESGMWQIDELSQRMNRKKSKYRRAWIITVSAIKSRYLLSTYVCERRCCRNTLKALKIARRRAKYDPKVIRCDGLKSHEKAAKKLFPLAKVILKTKKEHYGHISLHERIHKTVRMGAFRKRRRFFLFKTVNIYVEFARIDYNFVRINDAPEKTPAQRAGVDCGITNWRELLYCALRFHMKKQFIEENNKLKSKQKKKKGKSAK